MALMAALFLLAPTAPGAPAPAEVIARGEEFLLKMVDPDLGLAPEFRGAKVYWLYHDNYLAAKVLAVRHPEAARGIVAAMQREGVRKSGKIELLFGEVEKPLPFRQYQLTEVRRAGDKILRTEIVTERALEGWQEYADLLLLASIAEQGKAVARDHWKAAMKMWDGQGFMDAAAKHAKRYATYKLGLALIAANRLSPSAEVPPGLLEKLLAMQDESGGWITDYDAAGKRLGVANVETTSLALMGIELAGGPKAEPSKK
jgi:hypothetical protein